MSVQTMQGGDVLLVEELGIESGAPEGFGDDSERQ